LFELHLTFVACIARPIQQVLVGPGAKKSENAFVGGDNRWRFDTFVNWEYWWPGFPVLVYFKETQTKPEGQVSGGAQTAAVLRVQLVRLTHPPCASLEAPVRSGMLPCRCCLASCVTTLLAPPKAGGRARTQAMSLAWCCPQIHFFPIIMDGKQLYDVMVERCGPSKNSGPKP
jgi:hypothetical protein